MNDMNQVKRFVFVFVSVIRTKILNNYFDSTKYVVKFFWVGAFTGTTTYAVNWWCKILLDAHSLHWNRSGFSYLFLEFRKRVTIEIGVVVKFRVSTVCLSPIFTCLNFLQGHRSSLEVDRVSWIFDDRGADLQFFLASTWWGARCLPFQKRLLFRIK